MKRTLKRVLAVVLAAVTLLSLPVSSLTAAAVSASQLDEYTGRSALTYRPNDGFYGYLAVRMENGSSFKEQSLPVLVKNSRVLVSASEFGNLATGVSTLIEDDLVSFSANRKTIFLSANSARVWFAQGGYAAEYTMNSACVMQDNELWVPLQEVCLLLGMDLHDFVNNSVTISEPQKDILDTVVEILEKEDGSFSFERAFRNGDREHDREVYWALAELSVSSDLVDTWTGMFKLELDEWLDSTVSFFTGGLLDLNLDENEYMQEITQAILDASPDEAAFMNTKAAAFGTELAGLVMTTGDVAGQFFQGYADAALQELQALSAPGIWVNADNMRWFTKASENAGAMSQAAGAVGYGIEAINYILSAVTLYNALNHQDQMAAEGLQELNAVMERQKNSAMTGPASKGFQHTLSAYTGGTGRAMAYWLDTNVSSVFSTGVHAMIGVYALPLDTYNLAVAFIPGYSETLDAVENFQKCLVAMELQRDVTAAARTLTNGIYEGDQFDKQNFETDLDILYAWVKTCYVTRLCGCNAMNKLENTPAHHAQLTMLQTETQWLAELAEYTDEGFIDPYEMQAALNRVSADGLCDYVVPAYVRVYGTITDAETGESLTNVRLELNLGSQNIVIVDTVDHEYEYYLPLKWDSGLESELHPNVTADIGSVVVKASHADYESEIERTGNNYKPVSQGSGNMPAMQYELQLDITFGALDYYRYIRDEMLPEFGYSSLEDMNRMVDSAFAFSDAGKLWHRDDGLIGAVIADFDSDGTDECIVLRREGDGIYLEALWIRGGSIQWTKAERAYFTVSNQPYWFNWVGLVEVDGRSYLYCQWKFSKALVTSVGEGYRFLRMNEGVLYEAGSIWSRSSGDYYGYYVTVPVGDHDTVTYDHDQQWIKDGYFDRLREAGFNVGEPVIINLKQRISNSMAYDSWKSVETLWGTEGLIPVAYTESFGTTGNYSAFNTTITVQDYTDLRGHIAALED